MARLSERIQQEQKKPPNLRRGNARRRCGRCVHFLGDGRQGECGLYGWRVRSTELSDSFEAAPRPKGR